MVVEDMPHVPQCLRLSFVSQFAHLTIVSHELTSGYFCQHLNQRCFAFGKKHGKIECNRLVMQKLSK